MSLFITAYVNRTTKELITFNGKDASGALTKPDLATGSKVRIKIGRAAGNPVKDIVSGMVLGSGTKVTAENPATLTIVGQDFADVTPGVYDIEAIVVDHADGDKAKLADEGIFVLQGTQGGSVN